MKEVEMLTPGEFARKHISRPRPIEEDFYPLSATSSNSPRYLGNMISSYQTPRTETFAYTAGSSFYTTQASNMYDSSAKRKDKKYDSSYKAAA